MSFICALEILISALTFTLTKKFSNGFEIKLQLKGADMIMCIAVILMGVLGMVPTGAAGCRSAEYLRNERNIKHVKYKGGSRWGSIPQTLTTALSVQATQNFCNAF